ncbi:uncharacterized protein LOC142352229 [Convolutriloba macropyga]|uniref:uncharacterized protein LOC142352229 n=1 Tax=Convolutriloba macropyga TaxID=536237 RepID=UPI003F520CDF
MTQTNPSFLAEGLVRLLIFFLSLIRATLQKFSAALKQLGSYQKRREQITLVWRPPREISSPIFRTLDIQLTTPAEDVLHLTDPNQESNPIIDKSRDFDIENADLCEEKSIPNDNQSTNQIPCERESHLKNYLDQLMTCPFEATESCNDQDCVKLSSAQSSDVEFEFCPPQLPLEYFALRQQEAMLRMTRTPMVAIIDLDASKNEQKEDLLVF